jgi:hypothetical protein
MLENAPLLALQTVAIFALYAAANAALLLVMLTTRPGGQRSHRSVTGATCG